jgi:hypothetical protein
MLLLLFYACSRGIELSSSLVAPVDLLQHAANRREEKGAISPPPPRTPAGFMRPARPPWPDLRWSCAAARSGHRSSPRHPALWPSYASSRVPPCAKAALFLLYHPRAPAIIVTDVRKTNGSGKFRRNVIFQCYIARDDSLMVHSKR